MSDLLLGIKTVTVLLSALTLTWRRFSPTYAIRNNHFVISDTAWTGCAKGVAGSLDNT